MSDFVPSLDEVQAIYASGTPAHWVSINEAYAEFDRAMDVVRADALREFSDEVRDFSGDTTARHIEHLARARADRLDQP